MLKAVILIGGPQKGTRFRPLSLDVPKPLFPVAGYPIMHHHIEACSKVKQHFRTNKQKLSSKMSV
jgi:mannose-1-phosphate guanylyltransferase